MKEPLTKLSFSNALAHCIAGCKISREGWNGKKQYVTVGHHVSYIDYDGETVNPFHSELGNRVLIFHGTSGTQVGWLASQSDMLANDWVAFDFI